MPAQPRTVETAGGKLQVLPLTRERYAEWDQFCMAQDEAWFWHTSQWLEYTLHYRPDLQPVSHSFLCLHGDVVVAVCPLIVETYPRASTSVAEFSYGGDAVPAPALAGGLSEKTHKAVLHNILAHVDQLAEKMNVARACFRMSPLAPSFWQNSVPSPNPLVRLGFSDISLITQVVDLSVNEGELFRAMRNDHRGRVTRALRLLRARVLNSDTMTDEKFERYRLLHGKAAGRVTRPLATFQMMREWVRSGQAVLCSASLRDEDKDVGFCLISTYKGGAYYSSSCTDPEYHDLPIGHIMQWDVMQWLKAHGIRRYEIGLQVYANQPHAIVSEKELNIAMFKRGFGGFAVPYWRGEKFYDRSYCNQVLKERADQYAAALPTLR